MDQQTAHSCWLVGLSAPIGVALGLSAITGCIETGYAVGDVCSGTSRTV